MARALVTGVAGFAGSHLAEHLLAIGDEVEGVLLHATAAHPNLDALGGRVRLRAADVTDADGLCAALEAARPERIYHLAGFASPRLSFEDPLGCYRVNAIGTAALFEALRRLGARPRVLVVSSGEVYGRAGAGAGGRPIAEDAPLRPISPYGASKVAAEMAAIAAFECYAIPSIRARAFNHVGARQDPAFAPPAFARQVALAEAGRQPPEIRAGNLTPVRDLSDVRDVVRAYRALAERGAPGEVYNVASGRGIAIRDFLERLIARARVPLRIVEDPALHRPADIDALVGDPARLARATGIALGERPLDDTIEALLEDWRRRVR